MQRAAVDALGAPAGEKGAQIGRRAVGEIRNARGLAEAFLEKGEKLPGVAPVSLDRARRQAPLAREMGEPGDRRRGEVGRGGECGQFGEVVGLGHGRDDCARRVKRTLQGGTKGANIDRSNRLVKIMTDILEYQASEAKAKWAELLDEVERGRTVRITRHGKTIARVVPETDRRAAEIAEAIERLKALREKTGKAPLAEILASRHEGHKY